MTATPGPAPGFLKYPDHRVEIRPATGRWQAKLGDRVLADSTAVLELNESRHAPVLYFPHEDVARDLLKMTSSGSTCPFKGKAACFRDAENEAGADIAWCYPETYDEVAGIAGLFAFYADRVCLAVVPDK